MKRVVLVFGLAWLAMAMSACGDQGGSGSVLGQSTDHIVGGSVIGNEMPAVGSITYYGQQFCTGTLIGEDKVLTAAHCVIGFAPERMHFVLGADIEKPEAVFDVALAVAHPYYEGDHFYDIAVLRLAQPCHQQAPMAMLSEMDENWIGHDLLFVGFGVTNGYSQEGSGVKRAVWMTITALDEGTFRYDDTSHQTCGGDSGGPALAQMEDGTFRIAGVTSYGDEYCVSYGVDTRVDVFQDFLAWADSQNGDCEGETFEGRCDGQTVIWCENGQVYAQDCTEDEKVCAFSESENIFGCTPAGDPKP